MLARGKAVIALFIKAKADLIGDTRHKSVSTKTLDDRCRTLIRTGSSGTHTMESDRTIAVSSQAVKATSLNEQPDVPGQAPTITAQGARQALRTCIAYLEKQSPQIDFSDILSLGRLQEIMDRICEMEEETQAR